MEYKDITESVNFDFSDGELLPITKCICGKVFEPYEFYISFYRDRPRKCPSCGAKLFYAQVIRIYRVEE